MEVIGVDFQHQAKLLVMQYFNTRVEKTDNFMISTEDIYVVWFCKTLKNWKALLSTTVMDGMYYEVTFNGEKNDLYLDAYKKFDNVCVHLVDVSSNLVQGKGADD